MCGFAGQVGPEPADLSLAIGSLRHRGPDDEGAFHGPAGAGFVDFAFRRLAILDPSPAGRQPMGSEDGSVQLVLNGEIYGFRALRDELGGSFRSSSDTEVALRAYQRWGDAFLHRLRGMFALALWDGRRERLLLARDRLGIKPLYFWEQPGGIAFASEIKGLLALGAPRAMDPDALLCYLRYLYVLPPRTFFRAVRQLGPGEKLVFERGAARVERWWDLDRRPEPRDRRTVVESLRALLRETVRLHLESDVPVGAFLSGGLDSSTIVALMAEASPRPVRTFCMTFAEPLYDEREHARAVARRFGTEHEEIPVEPEIVSILPEVVRHFDEPFGNPTALLAWELSRQARRRVKVALAGDGGDEAFLGYPRYQGARLAEAYRWAPRPLRSALAAALAPLIRESTRGWHGPRRAREFIAAGPLSLEEMYDEWVGTFSPDEVERLVGRPAPRAVADLFARAPGGGFRDRLAYVDAHSFLPHNLLQYTDRMSMAHSLEVRVPFCDHKIVEAMAALPFDEKMPRLRPKALLREAMRGVLPEDTLRRKKLGFNPPLGAWMEDELRGLLDERLDPSRLRREGIFDAGVVAGMVARQRAGRRDHSLHLWALLVFQTWHELYRPT